MSNGIAAGAPEPVYPRADSSESYVIKTIKSLDELQRVWAFAAPILDLPTGVHTLAYYEDQLSLTPGLLVYAECGDRVVGSVLGSVERDHVLVGPVAVAADARRIGIGAAMMAELERQALAIGQTTLILGSVEDAEPFYLSCGFQPNLFIQVPDPDALDRLKAHNPGYAVAWEAAGDGWARLMLRTPSIDRPVQRAYEAAFPDCATQVVFIKHLRGDADG